MAYLLTDAAQIQCTHAAMASVTASNTQVKVNGANVVVGADIPTVSGCPFTTPEPRPSPCVTVEWVSASLATRIKINQQQPVLVSTTGICKSSEQIPQGSAVLSEPQTKVQGL